MCESCMWGAGTPLAAHCDQSLCCCSCYYRSLYGQRKHTLSLVENPSIVFFWVSLFSSSLTQPWSWNCYGNSFLPTPQPECAVLLSRQAPFRIFTWKINPWAGLPLLVWLSLSNLFFPQERMCNAGAPLHVSGQLEDHSLYPCLSLGGKILKQI